MKKLCFMVIFLSAFFNIITPLLAAPLNIDPECSYILIDSKSGEVLAEQNADVKVRPASTTKIMTAIVALENGKLDSVMNVSEAAVDDIGPGGMNIGIMPGENSFTLENLLNVMLIKSANETANIIAENIGGTRKDFINLMNKKAAGLGAKNTFFVNPCGKDNTKEDTLHLTTARDMSEFARYAMTIPKFREIVSKQYYNGLPATDKHSKWEILQSTNKLLWDVNDYPFTVNGVKSSYRVNGIKTGFTDLAGENLISSAVSKDGTELIAVVMHVSQANMQYSYTKALFNYGFESYSTQKAVNANQTIKSINVMNGINTEKLDLVTSNDFSAVLPLSQNLWKLETSEHINQSIKIPVKKGDILGYIEYSRNGTVLGKVNLIASRSILAPAAGQAWTDAARSFDNSAPAKEILEILILLGLTVLIANISKISEFVSKIYKYSRNNE